MKENLINNKFKIVLVTTNLSGGAGLACIRLHENLLKEGVDSHILTLYSSQKNSRIHSLLKNKFHLFLYKLFRKIPFLLFLRFYREHLKAKLKKGQYEIFSPPYSIFDLNKHPVIKEADVINFHWVSDLINYENFFDNCTKSIIWTLHDLNPLTGAFHYKDDVDLNPAFKSLDNHYRQIKHQALNRNKRKLHFITLCEWMGQEIVKNLPHFSSLYTKIPNALDIENFYPVSNNELNEKLSSNKKKIIFVSENINSRRKGFDIFLESLSYLENLDIDLIAVGTSGKKSDSTHLLHKIIYTGRIINPKEMAFLFSKSDLFVIPSREDNLPNVIIEANLMGCPVVGFDIGGISEMIQDGINGFKANELTGKALSVTIKQALSYSFNRENISKATQNKYSSSKQATEYINLINYLKSNKTN